MLGAYSLTKITSTRPVTHTQMTNSYKKYKEGARGALKLKFRSMITPYARYLTEIMDDHATMMDRWDIYLQYMPTK